MGFGGYKNVTTVEGQRKSLLIELEAEDSREEPWEGLKGISEMVDPLA